jgi:hypothetical protein
MTQYLSLFAILFVAACGGNSPEPASPEGEGVVEKTKEEVGEAVEEAGDDIEDATD